MVPGMPKSSDEGISPIGRDGGPLGGGAILVREMEKISTSRHHPSEADLQGIISEFPNESPVTAGRVRRDISPSEKPAHPLVTKVATLRWRAATDVVIHSTDTHVSLRPCARHPFDHRSGKSSSRGRESSNAWMGVMGALRSMQLIHFVWGESSRKSRGRTP